MKQQIYLSLIKELSDGRCVGCFLKRQQSSLCLPEELDSDIWDSWRGCKLFKTNYSYTVYEKKEY